MTTMMKRPALLLLLLAACIATAYSQTSIEASPVGVVTAANNEYLETPDTITEGGSYTGNAPIEVEFMAMVASDDTNLRYEWQFSYDSDFGSTFLLRWDENTSYSFTSAGTSYVRLLVTDEETEEEYESEAFSITVSESSLELPNAFSPNGDGINDYYKVSHQSLVSFKAYIFNRWGQQIYSWGIDNIDEGWDGTYKGRTVKDGVYFIVVEAVGADGITYKKKSSINVLTGTGDSN